MLSPQAARKIERYKAFYASKAGHLMVRISPGGGKWSFPEVTPIKNVDWSDDRSIRDFARSRLAFSHAVWNAIGPVDDDNVLFIQNLAGTGMVAAAHVKDAVLHQEQDTNYLQPPITSIQDDDFSRIGFDPENPWYRAQMTMLRVFIEEWDHNYSLIPIAHFSPCDLANQLRGNDIFYDMTDAPQRLHQLLEKCTQSILDMHAYTAKHYTHDFPYPGFSVGAWIPSGSYISCDFGDMISSEALSEFEIPYFQRIMDHWGGAYLHHHELGARQIPIWCSVRNLTVQQVHRDPNTVHMETLIDDNIIANSHKVPIQFVATYDQFRQQTDRWREGKFIVTVLCNDQDQIADTVRRAEKLRGL